MNITKPLLLSFILILRTLPGATATPLNPDEVPKPLSTDIFLIRDLLCKPDQDEKKQPGLNNFLNNLREFTQSKQSYLLPEWFQNTSITNILQVKKDLENCVADLPISQVQEKSPSPPGKPGKKRRINNINLVLYGFRTIKDLIDQETSLRKNLEEINTLLAEIRKLPLNREEWPPGSVCSQCESDWLRVRQVAGLKIDFNEFPTGNDRKLRFLFSSLKVLQTKKIGICSMLSELKYINPEQIEKDFGYYSWTRTYRSVKKIVQLVNEKRDIPCR